MNEKIKKALYINGLVLVMIVVGLAIFDASLTLGQFQGLAFYIYLLYALALQFLANLVLALIAWIRGRTGWAWGYLTSGIVVPLIGVMLTYAGATIVAAL